MQSNWEKTKTKLQQQRHKWLVTGASGFIGSHLTQTLLELGQEVVGLDNFDTSSRENLVDIQKQIAGNLWTNFRFVEGDIRNYEICRSAGEGVDYVLHQAALGSIPRSFEEPARVLESNLIYDTADAGLRARGELLRIRQAGG